LTINAPPQVVYDRISNFRRWPEWSPWEELDPNMRRTYEGNDGAVGSGYAWQGNRKAGAGAMTITALDAPKSASIDLSFLKPFKSQGVLAFDLAADGGGTKVTWTMTGVHTVMMRIMGIFVSMDKLVGKDFEKGLAKLKAVSEG
jgi:hypothetical protein